MRLAKDCSRKRVAVRNPRRCCGVPGVSVLACSVSEGVTIPQRVETEKTLR